MEKEIKYSGYTAQPSDYLAPDGDLALAINLAPDGLGHISPVATPTPILQLSPAEEILFIHSVTAQKNYIIRRTDPAGAGGSSLFWLTKHPDIDNTSSATPIQDSSFHTVTSISAIGLILIVATPTGLQYFRWIDSNYRPLGSSIPFPRIGFGLLQESILTANETFDIPQSCSPYNSSAERPDARPTSEDIKTFSDMVFGMLNKNIKGNISEKGFFSQPFFIRYAYRLFDGSYTMPSPPILMLPNLLPPIIAYEQIHREPAPGLERAKFTLRQPLFRLDYRIYPNSLQTLDLWDEVIVGIDIFISSPIYTYDTTASAASVRPIRPISNMLASLASTTRAGNIRPGFGDGDSSSGSCFIGHYHNNGSYIDQYYDAADSALAVYLPSNESLKKQLCDCHIFYKAASLDRTQIKGMDSWQKLSLDDSNLSTLTSRPTLPDDYQSHHRISATCTYAFNSRLNLAGVTLSPPAPFPLDAAYPTVEHNAAPTSARITVWSKLNGTKCVASLDDTQILFDPLTTFPRYIYYPDPSAYKMCIDLPDGTSYILDLTRHEFLNGAFWFNDDFTADSVTFSHAEPETDTCPASAPLPSKIYTSDANNPFTFPATNINTVGSGDVLALSSVAKALSQGQFGQFPLIAFTTEGIWALSTNATGGYTSVQPIARDVCTNPLAITQLDDAILFPSARGIMMVSGSSVQSISDTINSQYPFNVESYLPCADILHHLLGESHHKIITNPNGTPLFDYWDSCIPTQPFLDYISGASSRMLFDYVHQRVILYNSGYSYAYTYSLRSAHWGMMHSDILYSINSYPEALAVNSSRQLVDFSQDTGNCPPQLLVTRPLKLDAPDILKTIDTVIQRGFFRKGHISSVLYGSRDLFNWHLVWSSKDHFLRGFRGTPYKYFRIALLCNLQANENIFGATVRFNPKLTNRLR